MTTLRRVTTALLAAVTLAQGGVQAASTTDYSDQWWVEKESGWGASVLQQADVLFIDLFVYGADGKPTWFTAAAYYQSGSPAGHQVFAGDLNLTTGSYYGAPWSASALAYRKVGTLTFDATGVGEAVLTYTVDGTPTRKDVTRQPWRYENLSGTYRGGTSGEQTACGAGNGRVEGQEVIAIAHGADNSITLTLTDPQNRTRTIAGAYSQQGHLGQVVGNLVDSARGLAGTATLTEIQTNPSGITGRGHFVWKQSGLDVCVWDGRWGGVRSASASTTLRGSVLDGRIEAAVVCADVNRNGRCDSGEAQTRSGADGTWQLAAPADPSVPLVAEVIAGASRDSAQPGATVDASYRMASPTVAYSTNITPLTTLVHLAAVTNLPLAEDLVRNELGLPPRFDLLPAVPPANGSLTRGVEDAVVTALKATAATLDTSAPGALATVVAAFPPALTTLPTLRIATRAGAPILSKDFYIDATFELTNPVVSDQPMPLNGQIRGRGHSTWGQPKNPYHVKLAVDADYARLADVLGMKTGRHWALLADYFDRSLIRNKLALSLGSSSVFRDGLKWTPSGQHVEVWLNGDYVGVYLLTETIRIEPSRLDVRIMNKDPAANEVDGGYIVEATVWVDDCYSQPGIDLQHVTPQQVRFCVDKPDEEDVTVPQLAYIKNLVDAVENDVYGAATFAGLNLASVVDHYLVNELFRNNDAVFLSSVFMWKDTATAAIASDRLLNFGPVWDFDRGAGNVNDNGNWEIEGCWVNKPVRPNWFASLAGNPRFVQLAVDRWKQKRASLQQFIDASIDTYVRRLDGAEQRNFGRWPILGAQLTNHYTFATYGEEVAFVRKYLDERMAWMDKAFANPLSYDAMCR